MPQPTKGPRLGGSPDHQRLMLANLATSLFTHGRIHTTRAKADRLRPYAERLITKAKRGDLHNRRIIGQQIRDKDVVHRLMAEIGPFFADRPGGYTRITKTLPRKGDNAPMAIIELVSERTASAEASQATRVASQPPPQSPSGPGAHAGEAAVDAESGPAAIGAAEETGEDIDLASATGPGLDDSAAAEVDGAEDGAVETGSEDSSTETGSEDDVPEPMAGNAATSAGLDTEEDSSGSGDDAGNTA